MIITKNKNEVKVRMRIAEWIKVKYIFENFNIHYEEIKKFNEDNDEKIQWRFNNG